MRSHPRNRQPMIACCPENSAPVVVGPRASKGGPSRGPAVLQRLHAGPVGRHSGGASRSPRAHLSSRKGRGVRGRRRGPASSAGHHRRHRARRVPKVALSPAARGRAGRYRRCGRERPRRTRCQRAVGGRRTGPSRGGNGPLPADRRRTPLSAAARGHSHPGLECAVRPLAVRRQGLRHRPGGHREPACAALAAVRLRDRRRAPHAPRQRMCRNLG